MKASGKLSSRPAGKLYVCPTPIGNLEDVTLRVLRMLKEVDLIASEDTRRTRILNGHYGIYTPTISYQEHNEESRGKQLMEKLREGMNIALVSDAGMPGISDPGYRLIRACIEKGIEIEVLPGPDSITAALVSSGLPTDRFVFEGFLPRKYQARRKKLERMRDDGRTIVFFEAPSRLLSLIGEIIDILGDRKAVVVRELSKKFEEKIRGTLSTLKDHFESTRPRGEIVLVVEGGQRAPTFFSEEEIASMIHGLKGKGKRSKEISALLADRTGMSKKEAYEKVAGKSDAKRNVAKF